ncbi:hypothetical protein [Kordiimonas laminariae]|uniref:hypothetical protein n=1 Tax=Kordiimonas laminariae TaxID=2917717 RepID=UPI001FF240E4|nr:hypothetical protein [Kordiimonas laminariae]MCK0071204.1 hypothetical protein [Kordiimonas laminariae]
MARNKKRGPRGSAEADYWAALERLKSEAPSHPKLQKLQKEGRLEINASAVAVEANRSRTPISSENGRFPEIRKAIIEAQAPKEEGPRSPTAFVKYQRKKNTELREQNRNLESQLALMVAKNIQLEERLEDANREVAQIKKIKKSKPYEVLNFMDQ